VIFIKNKNNITMKISPSQVKKAIVEQALIIKQKQELYKRAQQLNEEVKKLNEMSAFETALGPGFVNSNNKSMIGSNGMPAQALGLMGSPMASKPGDSDDLNVVGSFKDLYNLDKEMQGCNPEESEDSPSPEENVTDLAKENQELKEKLADIQSDTGGGLNESNK
jgi:hypothetical protein